MNRQDGSQDYPPSQVPALRLAGSGLLVLGLLASWRLSVLNPVASLLSCCISSTEALDEVHVNIAAERVTVQYDPAH